MLVAKIAYFSGTGGAKRIAECAASELEEQGYTIDIERIGLTSEHRNICEQYNLLVLVSVVHEFNFPHQVRMWSSALDGGITPKQLFSVSREEGARSAIVALKSKS